MRSIDRPRTASGSTPRPAATTATHQYFGESRIAASIELAKNAVVLLNHLCYASGNAEPGNCPRGRSTRRSSGSTTSPPGSSPPARRRSSPRRTTARGVRQGDPRRRPVDRRDLAHGPERERSRLRVRERAQPGLRRADGPEAPDVSGFERSIVLREGLASADVLAGARGSASGGGPAVVPGSPDLLATGIQPRHADHQGSDGGRRQGDAPDPVQDQGPRRPAEVDPGQRPLGSAGRPARPDRPGDRGAGRPPMPGATAPSPVATSAPRCRSSPNCRDERRRRPARPRRPSPPRPPEPLQPAPPARPPARDARAPR